MLHTLSRTHLTSSALPSGTVPEFEHLRSRAAIRTGLFDTGSEDRFDRITRAAAQRFDTAFSILTLIDDDRMYVKSMVGSLPREVPREVGFCNVTIQSEDGLVISDTLEHPIFSTSEFVTGPPRLRFYAGIPLRGPSGWLVGTLCIMDTQPRAFTAAGLRALRRLADGAELELNSGIPGQVPQYVV